jgi:hypothetical protein
MLKKEKEYLKEQISLGIRIRNNNGSGTKVKISPTLV